MPILRPPVGTLINNARFSAADLAALRKSIQARTATVEDAKLIVSRYADTLEPGVGNQLRSLLRSLGSPHNVEAAIANLASDTGLLNGQVILPDSGRKHPSVRNVQRALIALASRTQQLGYMLPKFGADGDYGNETIQAVKVFQQRQGLAATGKVDARTAKALDQALRNTRVPGIMSATSHDIASAARELCTGTIAAHYGVPKPWINIDPNHNVPVERPFEFLTNKWKCNLFGGNVLRKGGFEPPYYGNQGKGEYPNANQWFKWSDKYAVQNGNKVHFQLIAEVSYDTLQGEVLRQAIGTLLSKAQPGDCLMADHLGTQVADGGHTRVTVANSFHIDGLVQFAQAGFDRAEVRQEGIDSLEYEEHIWLLRPTVRM
ncbi:peptidoglycan-binding protein [Oculatella sp. LEGE 06141]|uniref:peptidoglycan-binding domain-containing protein n=1 Tax=Oculatella sp. LEGE 06141 TaxID=1828648 RepID=UPI001880A8F9|nr:peptidoglycan-binding domain-containing protein [Oculatella sp. LEGE 06141]MBE9180812.1 peptidoglycan-binding protein [Oculatella sp. LEGE 06141]